MALELPQSPPPPDALRRSEPIHPRREVLGVTIDGFNSRELDDAFWIERQVDQTVIHVSIADVVSGLEKGSLEDNQAMERGFSLYGPDSVFLPMIDGAERFSLGSIRPTPTITVSVPVARGEVGRLGIERTMLRTVRKLSYHAADRTIQRGGEHASMLRDAFVLAQGLRRRRLQRGALEIETVLPLDERGQFVVRRVSKNPSEVIIQEFMLLVNYQLASFLSERGVFAVYRNQFAPGGMSAGQARDEIKRLIADPSKLTEADIARLRKMVKPAFFHHKDLGHFSLKGTYGQFTSPIRRYADIVNWRIALAVANNEHIPYSHEELEEISAHMNRRQQEARGEIINFQKAQARRTARAHIARGDFSDLNPKEFGRIIKVAASEARFTPELEKAIYDAMESGKLSDTDYCFLLFVAGATTEIPKRIRRKVLERVSKSEKMARNLLRMGLDTFTNWENLVYSSEIDVKPGKKTLQFSSARVTIGGNDVSSGVIIGTVPHDPELHAAIDLVRKLADPYPTHPAAIAN